MLGESLGCLFVFVESLRLALEKERSEVCKSRPATVTGGAGREEIKES